jgi:carboxyl-terminal processing protease
VQRASPTYATLFASALFTGGLMCGALAGRAAVARAQDPYVHLDLFARILTTIQHDYVEEIPPEVLVSAAIRGMVGELDSQSRWLDPGQLQELRDDATGQTVGLGIEVGSTDEGVEIVSVMPDSPASRDGLAEGDQVLAIDGQQLEGLELEEIRKRFAGERGAPTELTVLRSGWSEPRTISTVRDKVHRESVSGHLLQSRSVVYVRLSQFQEGSSADLQAEVEHLAASVGGVDELSGLVLDLRDNPGGLLSEAVAISDLFLDEGVIVSTRSRGGARGEEEVLRASLGGFPTSLPLVVLVNGMSASASEIVAGAIQDTKRGLLVGERTYGKGTVQQVYLHAISPLEPERTDEAALKLTVGRYFTPSGAPVAAEEGRTPDHEVPFPRHPSTVDQLRARLQSAALPDPERAELLALVDALPVPPAGRAQIPWDAPFDKRLHSDPQLVAALELLKD